MKPIAVAMLAVVSSAAGSPARAESANLDCSAYTSPRADPLATPQPGTSRPQSPYWADRKGDATEVFNKLLPESGLSLVKLEFSNCQGGALASTPSMVPPGGRIEVCDELFGWVKDKDQLASVIGHELGHIVHAHPDKLFALKNKVIAKWKKAVKKKKLSKAQKLASLRKVLCPVYMKASRDAEREADAEGQVMMHKAGYKAEKAEEVWRNMQDLLWALDSVERGLSHPIAEERAENARDHADELNGFERNDP